MRRSALNPSDLTGKQRIGSGSYAIVYACHLAGFEKPIALKEINLKKMPGLAKQNESEKNIMIVLTKTHAPYTVEFYGFYSDSNVFAIAMTLANSGTLTVALRNKSTPLSLSTCLFIMLGVSEALAHMHGLTIIHKDIKPDNVLLTLENGQLKPLVADFGLSQFQVDCERDFLAEGNFALGTRGYFAPEMIEKKNAGIIFETDIYSLGLLMWEVIERLNLHSDDLQVTKDESKCPTLVADLINSCLSFWPERRPKAPQVVEVLRKQCL